MSKTVLIHSFRHGVGRSSLAVNLTYLLALQGYRVGIIDTDIDAPVTHHLFGLDTEKITYSFGDYLQQRCSLSEAAYDVTPSLNSSIAGQIFLVPASARFMTSPRPLVQDTDFLNEGCQSLISNLKLDILILDTQPGVSPQSLVVLPLSDVLVIILRLDQRDYQGTSITLDLVHKLNIPRVSLIINETPASFDFEDVKTKIEKTYNCRVMAVLPYVEEIMALGNQDIFALRYPHHQLTQMLQEVASNLVA